MSIVKISATIVTIMMFLSNFIDSKRFHDAKSTGRTSITPLLSLLVNCSLWFKYGTLVNESVICIVNIIGVFCGVATLGIYWFYSTDKEGTEKKIVYTLLFLCSVLGYVRIGAGSDQTTVQLGILCACFSILLFGSPLLDIAKVIKFQTVDGILNFPLILIASSCSSLWTVIGFGMMDYNVIVPNFVGAILCVCQLAVYAVYSSSSSRYARAASEFD